MSALLIVECLECQLMSGMYSQLMPIPIEYTFEFLFENRKHINCFIAFKESFNSRIRAQIHEKSQSH